MRYLKVPTYTGVIFKVLPPVDRDYDHPIQKNLQYLVTATVILGHKL